MLFTLQKKKQQIFLLKKPVFCEKAKNQEYLLFYFYIKKQLFFNEFVIELTIF